MLASDVAKRLNIAVSRLRNEKPELFEDVRSLQSFLNQKSETGVLNLTAKGYSTFSLMPDHDLHYYGAHLPEDDRAALLGDWFAVGNDLIRATSLRESGE